MISLNELAVIIPVAPGDTAWAQMVADLKSLPLESEIIFVCPELPSSALKHLFDDLALNRDVRWLQAPIGRGRQLNAGVKASHKPYLWFLHADSRFSESALHTLELSLHHQPDAVHYFNLAFLDDGPSLTAFNTVGVWFRSHILGLPFGDQGFCLARKVFERLSGFREDVSYGEDHLFVWQARTQKISWRCTGGLIQTSARKYQQYGWCATTLNHLTLTVKQAFPELLKFLKVCTLDLLLFDSARRWDFSRTLKRAPKRGAK